MAGATIRLRDGRRLGYLECGDPAGKPVVFLHGWPGSRIEARAGDAVARKLGARIIAPDRPGMGLSDFQPGRSILDWPYDVSELADALGLGRFGVVGVSGGGPYAAACALAMPDRLTAAAIVSGLAPFDAPGVTDGMSLGQRIFARIGRVAPWALRPVMCASVFTFRHFQSFMASQALDYMPAEDRDVVLANPGLGDILLEDTREALRPGINGALWDIRLLLSPWCFRPEEIRVEVLLWHGEADRTVPPAMGRYLAATIPHCRSTFLPSHAHYLAFSHLEAILSALLA